ncbi:MFS transporter [Microtetraspora malaysiensis]|uniref:MFS transporter n=1 Tax=Microtetraspora malaysiensis TaxID=161358 RepID=UPI003D8D9CD2
MALFILIEATGIFEQVMVYTAIPTLMKVFDLDAADVSWVATTFLLVGAGTTAISGRLGDMYGRKKILVILMVLSTVGSIISVAFANFPALLVGRALQGTSAALFPLLVALGREIVAAKRVPVLVSITTGAAAIAGALAGVVAGYLVDLGDWRLMFGFSAVLAVLALIGAFILPAGTQSGDRKRIDVLGALLLAPSIASVLYGVNAWRAEGVTGPVLGYVFGGAAVFLFWIALELRLREPMFNLRLFKQRALVIALLLTALLGMGAQAALALMHPILMQSPKMLPVGVGVTATTSGLFGLIGGFLGFAVSPIGGRIAGRIGGKVPVLVGFVIVAIGFGMFSLSTHNLALAVVALTVHSLGNAFILAGIPNLIVEAVPAHNTGEAVGLVFGVARTMFTAIGTAIVGMLMASSVVPGTKAPTLTAWNTVTIFSVASAVLAILITFAVKRAKLPAASGDVATEVPEKV